MEMINRPRRLRTSANLRKMVRETRMDKSSLIYPMFIVEGTNIKEEIPSMMGQYRYSVDRMGEKLEELTKAGIGGVTRMSVEAVPMRRMALCSRDFVRQKNCSRICI